MNCLHCHQQITEKQVYENAIGEAEYVDQGHLVHCCKNWKNGCLHNNKEELSKCCDYPLDDTRICGGCKEIV